MVAFPPCKINLGLNVIRKRSDGYHDIETCFFPVPWTDILEVIPSTSFSFTQTGITIPGEVSENLCVKAYHLLKAHHDLAPVHIHLHKLIPAGAGLGGGSSDAANTIRLLNDVFKLNLTTEAMKQYAAQLGSDCSFFIVSQPMIGTGRGEQLQPVSLPALLGKYLVIIKPDIHVSTAQAYADVIPAEPEVAIHDVLTKYDISRWKEMLMNDFEPSVFKKFKEIQAIKEKLYKAGALYASMSGSGASVFGIFDHKTDWREMADGYTGWGGWLPAT